MPLPLNACAVHPEMFEPSLLNATVPVGLLPLTVAVNVTVAPAVDGFNELASVVVLVAVTDCDNAALDDALFDASPP